MKIQPDLTDCIAQCPARNPFAEESVCCAAIRGQKQNAQLCRRRALDSFRKSPIVQVMFLQGVMLGKSMQKHGVRHRVAARLWSATPACIWQRSSLPSDDRPCAAINVSKPHGGSLGGASRD